MRRSGPLKSRAPRFCARGLSIPEKAWRDHPTHPHVRCQYHGLGRHHLEEAAGGAEVHVDHRQSEDPRLRVEEGQADIRLAELA